LVCLDISPFFHHATVIRRIPDSINHMATARIVARTTGQKQKGYNTNKFHRFKKIDFSAHKKDIAPAKSTISPKSIHIPKINLYILPMLNYVFLILAIVAEAAGTTLLKMSEQFTKLVPSIASLVCYVASLYLLSLCLRTIPIGIAYATWSALGIALITISGIFFFKQMPDLGAIVGLILIVSGVAVLNLFSKMDIH
jgi:small multidrug resistance pump